MIPNALRPRSWLVQEDRLFQRRPYSCSGFKVTPDDFICRPSHAVRLTRIRSQIACPSISLAELLITDKEAPFHFAKWNPKFLRPIAIGPRSLVSGLKGQYPLIPYEPRNDLSTLEWRSRFFPRPRLWRGFEVSRPFHFY
jgi:hypothetical protein